MSIHGDSRREIGIRIGFVLTCTLIVASQVGSSELFAQGSATNRSSPSREKTRGFIDEYSNSFDSEFDAPRNPGNRRAEDGAEVDLKVLRPLIRAFSDGMTQLTYALNEQMGQVPGLRQSYADALRLSGTSLSINKHTEKHGFDRVLQDQLLQLDADWRELDYRLESMRGVPDETLDLVKDINDSDHKIRQLLGISPQLDLRQIYLKAAGLVADLENLQEDLASELGNGQEAQVYRRSVGRLRQIVLNLISVVRDERSDAGVIVEEYKQFETLWSPLVAKLRTEEDRYIERGLRRVAATAGEIHQLLLLPQKMDQTQFVYLASALKKDIDEFFERTPLILVMHLPKSKQALAAADQFYTACAQFIEIANRGTDQNQIVGAFRKIEVAERAFIDVYRDVDSDKAIAVLNRISRSVSTLRSSLQIQQDEFDSQTAEDLAASIQNFTEQIETAAKRWFEQDRQQFTANCLQDASDLTDRAAQLHDDIVSGKPQAELKNEMTQLYDTWRRVYGYLVKCQTDDRPILGRISSKLTPAMVDLRAMVLQ
jgi:hypothetical protein